jgi:protein SCO1/2
LSVPSEKNSHSQRGEERFFLGIVIALALVAGISSWFAFAAFSTKEKVRSIAPDKARTLVNFALTNSTGAEFTRDDVRGKILVVSFLFTSCSLTCPEVTRRMAEIQKLTADAPDVRLLSLTVDPRSDTVPVLAKWGARYAADTNRWHLLTGEQEQLHWVIGTSFLATETNNPFNSMPGNFAGTDRIAIVGQHGNLRAFFDGLRVETPAAVVAEINLLRKEK